MVSQSLHIPIHSMLILSVTLFTVYWAVTVWTFKPVYRRMLILQI